MRMDPQKQFAASQPVTLDLANGRDELNLAEYPLVLPFAPKNSLKVHSFESPPIWDAEAQMEVIKRITISPSPQYGYPGPFEQRVMVALISLGKQVNNFKSPKVIFTRYQLAKLLDLPDSGQTYKKLWRALEKLTEVTYLVEHAWWDHDEKTRKVKTKFNILDKVQWVEGESKGRQKQLELPLSYFVFGSTLYDSLKSNYIKRTDLNEFNQLRSFVAQQTYRLLTKRFWRTGRCEFDLRRFAHFHLALSPNYKTSLLKKKLESGIQELVDIGLIEDATADERYRKVGRGEYKIVFTQATPLDVAQVEEVDLEGEHALVRDLIAHGMNAAVARMIADDDTIAEETIREKIEILEWKLDRDEEVSNPGGWLRNAIRDDFTPPTEFEPKAVREQRLKLIADAKAEKAEKERVAQLEADQQKRDDKLRFQQNWEFVREYLDGLSEENRTGLIEETIAELDNEFERLRIQRFLASKQSGGTGELDYQLAMIKRVLPMLKVTS